MNNWFTVKVKYTKQLENGSFKRVSEPYLLAAMTFTDAEARIYEELGTMIKGEFNVVGITRTELHDVFHYDDADIWYKVKLTYETTDMDAEKTKKVSQNFLITANSVKEAYERIKESLSTLMVDFMIPAITQSPIVDVFPYAEELDREISRRPLEEGEELPSTPGGKVYSAPGSDEDEEEEMEDSENEMSDEYAED
ncbi:MAG: DUF4494 domain-containing protein [Crocinitomicaceae bacterium]|jgi:hypothetical protein|nr:DUF4494 domain-containing protein [Crocinitomicaceae bacterium]